MQKYFNIFIWTVLIELEQWLHYIILRKYANKHWEKKWFLFEELSWNWNENRKVKTHLKLVQNEFWVVKSNKNAIWN